MAVNPEDYGAVKIEGPKPEDYGAVPIFQTTPGGAVTGLKAPRGAAATFIDKGLRRDPGIDYQTGVSDFGTRAGFSFMEGEAEKLHFLDQKFGQGNWDKDSFGAYYVKPEGLAKLGVKSDQPISLDEQSITRHDLSDILGDVPAILGATGAGLAATGLGLPAGAGLTALGAAGGEAWKEVGKNLLGYRQRPVEEIAKDVTFTGVEAGAGEGVFRTIKPVGKFLMGPQAKRMTPQRKELSEAAREIGFKVRPGQVTDAPLLSRWEGMVNQMFGDLHQANNKKVAQTYMDDLLDRLGRPQSSIQVGTDISTDIIAARTRFSADAAKYYNRVDHLLGGKPIVSSKPIKEALKALTKDLPVDEAGNKVFPTPELEAFVKKYSGLADMQTIKQTQRIRTAFREAAENKDLVPGIAEHEAKILKDAADAAFNNLEARWGEMGMLGRRAKNALDVADDFYKKGIQQFDNPVIAAITRHASYSGAVDPDQVVKYIIKPEHSMRAARVKQLVSPESWAGVQRKSAEDLVGKLILKTDDPFKEIFNGKAFESALDSYGRETLEVVYGKQWVDDAYRFAQSVKLVGKTKAMSGGIVAAGIALHPIRNAPKLLYHRALVHLVQQPGTFKYLTQGILAPKTRAAFDSLGRIATQSLALARDETGSSKLLSPEARTPP